MCAFEDSRHFRICVKSKPNTSYFYDPTICIFIVFRVRKMTTTLDTTGDEIRFRSDTVSIDNYKRSRIDSLRSSPFRKYRGALTSSRNSTDQVTKRLRYERSFHRRHLILHGDYLPRIYSERRIVWYKYQRCNMIP